MSYACIRQGEHKDEEGLGFRRMRQCTGVTLLTVDMSPREDVAVYMRVSIIADDISL